MQSVVDMNKQRDIEQPKMSKQSFIIPIIETLKMDSLYECTVFRRVVAQLLRSTLMCT